MTLTIARSKSKKWEAHKKDWIGCTACPLHKHVKHYVLLRGTLPCQVLFIGEAPGEQEDALARPFVGPAGRILQALIAQSEGMTGDYAYAITNVVACKPFQTGNEIAKPDPHSIAACRPRLHNLIPIAAPQAVIALGKVSEKQLPAILEPSDFPEDRRLNLYHPSYILRKGGLNSLEFKRTLLTLVRFLKQTLARA